MEEKRLRTCPTCCLALPCLPDKIRHRVAQNVSCLNRLHQIVALVELMNSILMAVMSLEITGSLNFPDANDLCHLTKMKRTAQASKQQAPNA